MIQVTVAYALPGKQVEISLTIEESCNLVMAIKRSGILQQFPKINLEHDAVCGIHGRRAAFDTRLHRWDRIEIYRPLMIDPKQARLFRAQRYNKLIRPRAKSSRDFLCSGSKSI